MTLNTQAAQTCGSRSRRGCRAKTSGSGARILPPAPSMIMIMAVAATVALAATAVAALTYDAQEPHEAIRETLDVSRAAYAQGVAGVAGHVVINEIDTNPPGSDTANVAEWVELYNPTSEAVEIGGWQISSTTGLRKAMTIPEGTSIKPGQYLTYTYERIWFADVGETAELRDGDGTVIHSTPRISDTADDSKSWQLLYDGYSSGDSALDWRLHTSTPGSSNGKIPQAGSAEQLTITLSTDRESYSFGQTATINGAVSERRYIEKPFFTTESVTLEISGPGYSETVTMYPDANLEFSTLLILQQVRGIQGGTYELSAQYSGASASASFEVGYEEVEGAAPLDDSITITVDSATYTPGQEVVVSGTVKRAVQFATFDVTVVGPDGSIISTGSLGPVNGRVGTSFLLSAVNPAYGTHTIHASYAGKSATASFEVVAEQRVSERITLTSDSPAYEPGQSAVISGKINNVWAAALDLKIVQTRQGSVPDSSTGSHTGFKRGELLHVAGDGSFEYTFHIPNSTQRLGDYWVTVAGGGGTAGIVISVVEDADSFVAVSGPLTITTGSPVYELNEPIVFTGYATDAYTGTTTEYATTSVRIHITDSDGSPLRSQLEGDDVRRGFGGGMESTIYEAIAVPEESGRYTATINALPSIFGAGNYTAVATYKGLTATTEFSISDQYDISEPEITTDKEVYGLGETVTVNGALPGSGTKHVSITLTKPDGSTIHSSAPVVGQHFSWEWDAPKAERKHTLKEGELRGSKMTVFGAYTIKISTSSHNDIVYFKVSEDPLNDSLAKEPLIVTTSKALYKPGDDLEVSGIVTLYEHGGDGLRAPLRVAITVSQDSFPYTKIYEAWVYPDNGGEFSSEFDLPLGVFKEGSYKVSALYGPAKTSVLFRMANDYVVSSSDPLSMSVSTDAETYHPGQTVTISGGPNKIIYVEDYRVSVYKTTGQEIDCGTAACGDHRGPVTKIKPGPTASFVHHFTIPEGSGAVGTYEVTAQSTNWLERITFEVVEEPQQQPPPQEEETSPPVPEVVITKHNRLPGSEFVIDARATDSLVFGDVTLGARPVSVSGSMITTAGEEQSVNLQVLSEDGACLIGPSESCMISGSTESQGGAYATVQLEDGTPLRVVYGGPDKRLEYFAIHTGAGEDYLPDMTWTVNVLKDDQVSRFYYKVAYKVD